LRKPCFKIFMLKKNFSNFLIVLMTLNLLVKMSRQT